MLRAIRDDLVEKRLWPVAVVLVLLLIGAPIVLARGGSSDAPAPPLPPPAPVASAGAAAPGSEPVVLERAPRQVAPKGRFHDPFRSSGRRRAPAAGSTTPAGTATAVTPAPAPSAPSAPSSATAPSTPSATLVKPSAPAARPAPAPAPAPAPRGAAAGYRVDLSWGDPAGLKTHRDVTRLTVLRAAGEPALVFLGVRPDGETAAFLLASQAKPSGDGRCRPSGSYCHVIELQRGDSEFLDVATPDGIVQYELHVDRVVSRRAADRTAARKLLARVSKAGRAVRGAVVNDGGEFARRLVYAPTRGVLVFRPKLPVAPAPGQ